MGATCEICSVVGWHIQVALESWRAGSLQGVHSTDTDERVTIRTSERIPFPAHRRRGSDRERDGVLRAHLVVVSLLDGQQATE